MQILLTTDNHIEGNAKLTSYVESLVKGTLEQFGNRITRVEVHLQDQNSHKSGGNDKRCTMEARVGGLAPVSVTADAANVDQALDGAVDKLLKSLRKTFDKLGDHKGRPSMAGESNP